MIYRCPLPIRLCKQGEDESLKLRFAVSVSDTQATDFILQESSIGFWLSAFTEVFAKVTPQIILIQPPPKLNLFPIQYTHACCCNWLNLVGAELSIEVNSFDSDIRLVEPPEKQLLRQIIAWSDDIFRVSPDNYLKLAMSLCRAFWKFEGSCLTLGHIRRLPACLRLVLITQIILRWMLEKPFQAIAFTEL